jgi:hypothetical protein
MELVAQLRMNGIEDSEALVNRVFAKTMDSYTKAVLAKAMDISAKSDEVRNELGKMVACASYKQAETASVEDKVITRLSNPVKEISASVEDDAEVDSITRLRRTLKLVPRNF